MIRLQFVLKNSEQQSLWFDAPCVPAKGDRVIFPLNTNGSPSRMMTVDQVFWDYEGQGGMPRCTITVV